MAVFTETPHEFVAVKLLVAVVVHAFEDVAEATDSVCTTCLKGITDLGKDLERRLALNAKGRVNIGIVTTAAHSKHKGEFFIIETAVAVFVVLAEDSMELEVLEGASESLEGLFEFIGLNCTQTITVEVLEDLLNSPSLILGTVCALADLFKDNVLHLCEARGRNASLIRVNTPGLDEHINEVVLLLVGHHGVDLRVVAKEGIHR